MVTDREVLLPGKKYSLSTKKSYCLTVEYIYQRWTLLLLCMLQQYVGVIFFKCMYIIGHSVRAYTLKPNSVQGNMMKTDEDCGLSKKNCG